MSPLNNKFTRVFFCCTAQQSGKQILNFLSLFLGFSEDVFRWKVCPFVMSHSQVLVQPCFCLYSRYVIDPTKHQLQQCDCKNRGLNLLPLLQCHADAKDVWQDQNPVMVLMTQNWPGNLKLPLTTRPPEPFRALTVKTCTSTRTFH